MFKNVCPRAKLLLPTGLANAFEMKQNNNVDAEVNISVWIFLKVICIERFQEKMFTKH